MNINETLSSKTVIGIIVVIILLPLGYSAVRAVLAQPAQSSELFLEKAVVVDAEGDKSRCIIEAQYGLDARYQHMDFLKKTREEAMRAGIRGDVGIRSCQQCHKNRQDFCSKCHSAVNLNLDGGCFRCHHYPSRGQESP